MFSVYQIEIIWIFLLPTSLISWQQPGRHQGSSPAEHTDAVGGIICTGLATGGPS